ncbi:MAG: SDR family oxidoreductase [Planctomycetes bacterium]|nr:SDR family oxidoreductase [Planctomycetota bacterium]
MAKYRRLRANRVALITGAGLRLGRAMALDLANQAFDLVLHANRSAKAVETLAKELRAQGRAVKVLKADLSNARQAEKLAREAWAAFGGVDLLVNNAGIFGPTPLEKLNAAALDEYYAVNLRAPYILAAELGRRMRAGKGGSIVNLACVSAAKPWKDYVPYSISKAGVAALTVGLAKLLAPKVRVNAIAPGTVLPPEDMPARQREALRARLPLQRLGRPEDIVRALRYLVAADFVTGQVLYVDGGRSVV